MRRTLVLVLVAVLLASACDDDARVLWERPGEGGEGPGSSAPATGAGGEEPMPPPLPPPPGLCNEPERPPLEPCACLPGEDCACGPLFEPPPEGEPCIMICDGGECHFVCEESRPCETECGEACDLQCLPGAVCHLGCAAGCSMVCEEGSECHLWSWEGPSEIFCAFGAICDCALEESCACIGPGCP